MLIQAHRKRFRPSLAHGNVLFMSTFCVQHGIWNDTWINSELRPQAEFYSALNPGFHANGQLNISHGTNLVWMCLCSYVQYVWQINCVYVCVCEKLALTSSLLSSMFYLTNSQTTVLLTPTAINNHEAKTARLSQSYIRRDWHHTDVRQRTNLQQLSLQYRYNIRSTSSSLLPAWLRVKAVTVKVLVWMDYIKAK